MNFVTVTVSQSFQHSADRVFGALLDPEIIRHWMFGDRLRDEEVLGIKVDPRAGGEFSFLVRRPANPGGTEIDHVGRYLDISRPNRLSFTWAIGKHDENSSRVTIEVTPGTNGCEVVLVHEIPMEWAEYADRTSGAWQLMLGTLANVLGESRPAP